MKVVISPRAKAQIDHQTQFGIERHGPATAARTFARVEQFMTLTLASHPRAGRAVREQGYYEWPISRTPFIVVYRIDENADTVRVLGFFHHAQEREGSDIDDDV